MAAKFPIYYDSMIAKLIVHGTDRADAIDKMRDALNGFVIRGISSNIPFQSALLAHESLKVAISTRVLSPSIMLRVSKPKMCHTTIPTFW